jgi:hypothetical protein
MKSIALKLVCAEKAIRVLGAALGVLLFSLPLFSQGNFGRILGIVTDQSGGVVAGATVTVLDTQRGDSRTLVTDEAGEYNAPTLIPGTYTVRVEAKGFKRLERQNVVLQVGQEIRVDLVVQPGDQTQSVTVTEAVPLVETTSATLGGTIDNAEIIDMPLNGRNYQSLMTLRPGVTIYPGAGPETQSTNGVRPDESVWMVDGVLNSDFNYSQPIVNAASGFTDMALIMPIDAIQEFNLEENPKAEYGWKPGAVVNVGIKSGTNSLHGSAYAFGRDQSLDARNFFNPAPNPILPTQLEQFGAVVGGPIKKDKLFFFAGYEGLRSLVGNIYAETIPETGGQPTPDPANSLVDAINSLMAAHVTPSPVSLKLVGCTLAPVACTGGLYQGASPNTTAYDSTFPTTNESNNGVGKIDFTINDKNRLSGMFWTGYYNAPGNDHGYVNQSFESTEILKGLTSVIDWTWTPGSRISNEARFGLNRFTSDRQNDDVNVLPDGSGLTGGKGYPINTGTGVGGLPVIGITGFASLGATGNAVRGRGPDPFYDFQDNVSYLWNKHSFKFGFEFAHIEADNYGGDEQRGEIDFMGGVTPGLTDCPSQTPGVGQSCPLEDFLAGNPTRGFLLVGNSVRTMRWTSTAGFAQDDWRITPKFTLNLGLRYEYKSPIRDIDNLWGNFDPNLGMVQQGQPSVGPTIYKPDYKNFSPRLGFAWDITGKGTTVVRGGASVIYSSLVAAIFLSQGAQNSGAVASSAVPTGACTTAVSVGTPCPQTFGGSIQFASIGLPGTNLDWNGVVFPTGSGVSCTAANPCDLQAVDPNLRTPSVANYNLGVQHAFTKDLALEIGYVGNHGKNLLGLRDINEIDPATGLRPFGAQFPYLRYINQISNYAISNYNSLQATLTERVTHGVSFIAGYTYSHGLDSVSLNRNGLIPQNSFDPGAEYADGDFDIRHRFTFTTSYDIPGKKGFGQMLEGWKVNGIVTVESGIPWIVNDFSNNFSGSDDFSDRWDFFGKPSDFTSGSSSIPYCSGFAVTGTGGIDSSGVSCTQTSGVSGITTNLPSSLAAQCTAVAPDPSTLAAGGCYVKGNSVMVPPKAGTFGTMGRNIFRDGGFKNVDFSIFKNFTLKERIGAQFRLEFFNIFNHPNIANPYGSGNTFFGGIDPSLPQTFGCGCTTPDVAAGNPIIGSGSARDIQLGLKITF